jgi:hypothetical protein
MGTSMAEHREPNDIEGADDASRRPGASLERLPADKPPRVIGSGGMVGGHPEAAAGCPPDQRSCAFETLIDHELVEYAKREGDPSVTVEDVLRATATIPGSMSEAIIDEERTDRE